MSQIPQIVPQNLMQMHTDAKDMLNESITQRNFPDESLNAHSLLSSGLDKKTILEEQCQESKSQSMDTCTKEKPSNQPNQDKQWAMLVTKQSYIITHKRKLKLLYPNLRESEAYTTASHIWDELSKEEKELHYLKSLQNIECQSIKQVSIPHGQSSEEEKIQHSNAQTETKNDVPGLQAQPENVQPNNFSSIQREQSSESLQSENRREQSEYSVENNRQNDETNTSSAIGEYSNSQVVAPMITFTLVTLDEIEKSESNSYEIQGHIFNQEQEHSLQEAQPENKSCQPNPERIQENKTIKNIEEQEKAEEKEEQIYINIESSQEKSEEIKDQAENK